MRHIGLSAIQAPVFRFVPDVRFHGVPRHILETGLLEFHQLVGAITDIELIVKPFAAV